MILQVERLFVKVHSQHGWFAAVPHKLHYRNILRCNIFVDILFQHLFAHPETPRRVVHLLFFKIITIMAIQIANGTKRLCHDVEYYRYGLIGFQYANFCTKVLV